MTHCDVMARSDVQRGLSRAEEGWLSLLQRLDERRHELETLLRRWRGVEAGLDDGLLYLKQVRQQLQLPLPDSFDQLQLELHKCQVRVTVSCCLVGIKPRCLNVLIMI